MPESLRKRLVKRYSEDPIAEILVKTQRNRIDYAKDSMMSKYEGFLDVVVGVGTGIALTAVFAFLVYWYYLGFSSASLIPLAVIEVLNLLVAIPLYSFFDEVIKSGNLLNLAAKQQLRKEYRQLKKHRCGKFVPDKIFKVEKRGTSDSSAILMNDKYIAFKGGNPSDEAAMDHASVISYRVIENDRTVFLSRRGSEPDGLEYFGLREETEAVSKDFEEEADGNDTVRSIYIAITYTVLNGEETEIRLPFSVTELDRDSVAYNNALSKLLHILRELEFVINQSKTFIGE